MAEGKIREQGAHRDLLQQNGLYRQLIRTYKNR
jgi:ABC-type transport system involved in Fe-S cluster assembly fused permease/ATPase subunit